jgi:hypothetical protein
MVTSTDFACSIFPTNPFSAESMDVSIRDMVDLRELGSPLYRSEGFSNRSKSTFCRCLRPTPRSFKESINPIYRYELIPSSGTSVYGFSFRRIPVASDPMNCCLSSMMLTGDLERSTDRRGTFAEELQWLPISNATGGLPRIILKG